MEPSRNTYIAFSTIRMQFLVHRNRTLLGVQTYESHKLVWIYYKWHVTVHLEHGD